MVSFSARWEKYLQMLLRKAEEQEKEDRENPENRTKPKPAPEKEAPWTDPILLEKSCCWTKAGKIHHLSQVLDELGFTRRVVLVVVFANDGCAPRTYTYSLAGIAAEE